MSDIPMPGTPRWDRAGSLLPTAAERNDHAPRGALVPVGLRDNDKIAVIYDKGQTPPTITIQQVSGSVHKVMANGIAVAVVASANRPAPCKDDVLLVERSC